MKNEKLLEELELTHKLYGYDGFNGKETIQVKHFLECLKDINKTNPVMIELGVSHKPKYSKAFCDVFGEDSISICTEVLEERLEISKKILPNTVFYQGYSGKMMHLQESKPSQLVMDNSKRIYLKNIIGDNRLDSIDILHMDIQGSEMSALQEIKDNKIDKIINYYFISLHDTLNQTKKILDTFNIEYLFIDPNKGGNGDGLIVCKNKDK